MKRMLILLTLLSLLLVTSCELFTEEPIKGDVYYINVALDYENNSNADNLKGTLNDAEELHLALGSVIAKSKRTGTGYRMIQKGSGFIGDDSYTIKGTTISNYPSKANIDLLLEKHAKQTNENDLTIFTYSGHGIKESGHLLLAKTVGLPAETLSPDELLSWIDPIPGKKLIILDSCFSGMFVEESPSSTNTVLNNSIQEFFETYYSSEKFTKPDLFVLTASTHTDSYEMNFGTKYSPHNHGVFTYTLLEALGWDHPHSADISTVTSQDPLAAKNERITVDGLFEYIKKNQIIPSRLKLFSDWTKFQHPMTTGGPLDLVLFNL